MKNGPKSSLIKIPKISELNSYSEFKKQKYKCRNCNKTFDSSTSIVENQYHISNNTKHAVINNSKKVIPHAYIAEYYNVSNMSVQRVVDSVYDNKKLYKHYLSEVLCIDKFTALKRK